MALEREREKESRNLKKIEEGEGLYSKNKPLFICTTKFTQGKSVNSFSGITLIALVVTIVVLLILASVSITAVFGDNGLLKLAKEAAEKTNEAVKNESKYLAIDIDDIINPPVDIATLTEIVTENTKAVDKYGNKITIPAGFSIVPNGTNYVEYNYDKDENGESTGIPTVNDGIVITDTTGNEFVWVPVFSETPIYTTYNGKNIGLLYNFGSLDSLGEKFVKTSSPTPIEWSDNGYREPDFLGVDLSVGGGTYGIDALKNIIGINIAEDDKIEGSTENEKILNKWKQQLQDEFDYLVKSVNKYKGFYIGRYETGHLIATGTVDSIEEDIQNIPVVQKGRTDIGGLNWYYQYQTTKNISLKNKDTRVQKSVTSSMIWGSQWDAVMNWFLRYEDTAEYVTDSTDKGNFTKTLQPTGYYQVKNIYDLAGNVVDWTMEVEGNNRIRRGGLYIDTGSKLPACFRTQAITQNKNNGVGSRSTLIINL